MSSILSKGQWWMINKKVKNHLGLETSLMLSELIDKQEYFGNREMLDEEGYFYLKQDDIEKNIGFNSRTQRICIKVLIEKGFLETTRKGMPPVLRYRVDYQSINDFLTVSYNA